MGWKERPYWLKGGIIIILFYILIGIVFSIYDFATFDDFKGFFTFMYFVGPGSFIFGIDGPMEFITSFIFTIAIYFIIGAIIGWIYGKIKNR